MRQFGIDNKEFFEFKLGDSEEVYKIPLAASMPVNLLLEMQDADKNDKGFEVQLKMLKKYMGDVVDELTANTCADILKAWADESKTQGASVGESQASSE